jgi:hypothetical protein
LKIDGMDRHKRFVLPSTVWPDSHQLARVNVNICTDVPVHSQGVTFRLSAWTFGRYFANMTLWAIAAAPLYMGDDLTSMDTYGRQLLTNDEVIGLDQAGIAGTPISQGKQQVWRVHIGILS